MRGGGAADIRTPGVRTQEGGGPETWPDPGCPDVTALLGRYPPAVTGATRAFTLSDVHVLPLLHGPEIC